MDMFFNSLFDKNELEKEKFVVYEEMKMYEDSPEDDIHDIICELVFKGIPLSHSIIGTTSSLSKITPKTIRDYIKNEYTQDSIVISVAGKFEEAEIIGLIEEKLSKLELSKEKKVYEDVPHVQSYKVKVKDIEQTHICFGTRSVKLDDERYFPFAVLNNILGGSMGARLFQSIREEKGLAYSVYSSNSSFVDTGLFNIYAGVAHDKVREAVEAIKDELVKLKKDGITEEELTTAKEQIKGGYIFSQESVNGRMFSNGRNMALIGKVYKPEMVIESINKVTMDRVNEVADMINDINNYSGVLITDKKVNFKKWVTS